MPDRTPEGDRRHYRLAGAGVLNTGNGYTGGGAGAVVFLSDADVFGWPTPDVRVTRDWYEDEDDVTKTVTLVWQVDPETWETLVKHKEKGK